MVRYLGLKGLKLGDSAVGVVMEGLKLNGSVEVLDLSSNAISDTGCQRIADMLQANSRVRSLLLAHNKIRSTGAQSLATALLDKKRFRKLDLTGNKLRDGGATAFAEILQKGAGLQELDLSRNEINHGGCRAIAKALETNRSLNTLNLANNLMGEAFVDFGPALSVNDAVLDLNVENNMITAHCAAEFAAGLWRVSLLTLNVSNNAMQDQGLCPILDCLKDARSLRYLDVSSTTITGKSMQAVARLLQLCPMETLELDCNAIGADGLRLLTVALEESDTLQSLNVGSCAMRNTASAALATALLRHPKFTSLNVSGNHISDEGCHALCQTLKRMTMLKVVDLSYNQITSSMKEEIASVFINNLDLLRIEVMGNPVAADLVNGVLSRRVGLQALEAMDTASQALAVTSPLTPVEKLKKRSPGAPRAWGTPVPGSPLTPSRGGSPLGPPVMKGSLSASGMGSGLGMSSLGIPMRTSAGLVVKPKSLPPAEASRQTGASLWDDDPWGDLEDSDDDIPGHTPLVLPKYSLEHPYYPGWGKGRFSNASMVQVPGEVVPYTISNSHGPKPISKWCSSLSTSDALFAAPLRRRQRGDPYSQTKLARNSGGLLVTEKQLQDAFNELDVDGNGWLNRAEFEGLFSVFENFGAPLKSSTMNSILSRYRMFDDGKLTFDEFCLLMLNVAQR
jgi:Ran GTPase-activating protein (RanGAP) involved in mRNA processing and transport